MASNRMTISIPPDLKEQMETVAEQVNWSALAVQAFRQKLIEIRFRGQNKMSKQDVIDRMRAAKELDSQGDYEEGKQAGREWAEQHATPKELRLISKYLDSFRPGDEWWDGMFAFGHGAHRAFARAARPILKESEDTDSFWQEALGDGDHEWERIETDRDFLHGFGDGAVEVWEEVADDL